ncbi:unnamed protein product [Cuscuta campestris]|uniref:CDC20/Fizzy WD40 domain-containing protein n=1 Tax=Cuscuta campestris TaxID=132261 RepID=A0A484NCU4_9ASTE|nr:unnamed protein product [Cuscuta campestris]
MDGMIFSNDVQVRSHIAETYKGHSQEVCGLIWSASGQQLASGGNDNLLYIWDRSSTAVSSSNSTSSTTQWLHRFEEHTAAVKALAWCPFQGNLLASGGGGGDRCIKFWNTHTGSSVNSVDTGSQVCALLWNKSERELLSSNGFTKNQLTLWKYPSMVKMAELTGHTSRVLFMAQWDRFIPNRSAMDFDYAHFMVTEGCKAKEIPASSPSREAYRKQLAEIFNMNRRILAFKNKPPTPPLDGFLNENSSAYQAKPTKPLRHIPQTSERTLDAPDILDDYYLNLLDWGSSNVLSIALGSTVYLPVGCF